MAYANLDDDMGAHPSIRHLSDAAFRLHICGILYCAKWLTDGHIPAEDVPDLVKRYRVSALTELIDRGRWSPIQFLGGPPTHYVIEDYLDHNPTRETVLARKAKSAERQAKWRQKAGNEHGG